MLEPRGIDAVYRQSVTLLRATKVQPPLPENVQIAHVATQRCCGTRPCEEEFAARRHEHPRIVGEHARASR